MNTRWTSTRITGQSFPPKYRLLRWIPCASKSVLATCLASLWLGASAFLPTTFSDASDQRVDELNAQLRDLAAAKHSTLSPVILVDQNTGFDPDPESATADTFDGVHPNEKGEQKMAQRWFAALSPLLRDAAPCR